MTNAARTAKRFQWGIACLALLAVIALSTVGALADIVFTDPNPFKVTNVAADDVLNVRREPDAGSHILGGLKPDARPVEVFETQGNWGRIVFGESNGWVSLDFLSPVAVPVVPGTQLPQGLLCNGTEPFWNAEVVNPNVLTFETPDGFGLTMNIEASGDFESRPKAAFVWAGAGSTNGVASIRRQICSDGMSDRDYPYSVDLIVKGQGSASGFEGCCSLPVFQK